MENDTGREVKKLNSGLRQQPEAVFTKERKRRPSAYGICAALLLFAVVALNLAVTSSAFCAWYVTEVYSILSDTLGRLSDAIPLNVGELLMYAGILLLMAAAGTLIFAAVRHLRGKAPSDFAGRYLRIFFMICLVLAMIYTTNWFLPFRINRVELGVAERTYTVEELETLRNYLTDQLNAAAEQVDRGADGAVTYCENPDAEVAEALQAISDEYPLLTGYYPTPKVAYASDFFDWMDIGGYTYPYTMEITVSRYLTDLYYPTLAAHEQSHHQGYYQEDDATFLSFLACSGSKDTRLNYSAYDAIYSYVNNAYIRNLVQSMDSVEEAQEHYLAQPQVSDLVKADEARARAAYEEEYSQNVNRTLEKLSPAAEAAADVGWKTQSDLLGEASYGGVVKLLLQYYDGSLY